VDARALVAVLQEVLRRDLEHFLLFGPRVCTTRKSLDDGSYLAVIRAGGALTSQRGVHICSAVGFCARKSGVRSESRTRERPPSSLELKQLDRVVLQDQLA